MCSVLHTETGHPAPKERLALAWPNVRSLWGHLWRTPGCVFCTACCQGGVISVWRTPGCVLCTAQACVRSSLFGGLQDVCCVLHVEACVGSSLFGGGQLCLAEASSVWRRPGCVLCTAC